jgi:transglutaminase-like putative cysteine protease
VVSVKGNSFELRVRQDVEDVSEAPGAAFTESSYFITSADPRVQQLARQAIAPERDPWKKALRIERWVKANMQVRTHEALATADHVARTLEGDCTEFAMLTAAMCRAAGIPSRTSVGLIYADVRSGPVFAFHMWTEVWIDGRWRAIDATLGQGRVGAAHLKIADQSWHDERSLTPLLPVVRVLGKLSIEVLQVTH